MLLFCIMTEIELKAIVADNLIAYRKKLGYTQVQLADKLSYSDKSISKWERGESLPDFYVMTQIADFYGITLNDLISTSPIKPIKKRTRNHYLIPIMGAVSVYALATIVFTFLSILVPELEKSWLAFIYALPISLVVFFVFAKIWGRRWLVFIFASLFLWSVAVGILLSFSNPRIWLFFIACIPFQILLLLWLILKPKKVE